VLGLSFVSASMRVVEVLPHACEQQAAVAAPIRVVFSHQPEAASLRSHFHIEPGIDGSWSIEGDEAVFLPERALDAGATYSVTLEAGIRGQGDRYLADDFRWQFRTRKPQLLYLGWPEPGAAVRQLFVASPEGTQLQLTDHSQGVWDYTVHPQGEAIVYSALRDDGGADLWRMDRDGAGQEILLACPEAACLNPAWSPEGSLLAYERRNIWAGAPNLDPSASSIWLLDLEDGEERPVFDYDIALHSPVWAPSGQQLAYMSPTIPGVEVYDLDTGQLQQYANQWGATPAWSPDGTRLVLAELVLAGDDMAVRLVRIELADEQMVDISGDEDFVRDVAPAWSPGGGWIAMGRQFLDDRRWTPGRQIWLTRPDASEAYGIPGEGTADHYGFAWRPDGAALAYARADLSQSPQAIPDVSVWIFDFNKGEPQLVSDDAVLPKWLP
jgi:Tol biopolymer transport system component